MKSKDIIIPGNNVSLKLIKNTDIEEYFKRVSEKRLVRQNGA